MKISPSVGVWSGLTPSPRSSSTGLMKAALYVKGRVGNVVKEHLMYLNQSDIFELPRTVINTTNHYKVH